MWNRLLIFLRLRPDFVNDPEWTPPAFIENPHVYDPNLDGKVLTYCALCGGGRRHSIHIEAARAEEARDLKSVAPNLYAAIEWDSSTQKGRKP